MRSPELSVKSSTKFETLNFQTDSLKNSSRKLQIIRGMV